MDFKTYLEKSQVWPKKLSEDEADDRAYEKRFNTVHDAMAGLDSKNIKTRIEGPYLYVENV